jgi:hypothetical protein
VLLGGSWGALGDSGSRSSFWAVSPSFLLDNFGGRGVCDHLKLV